MRGLAERIEEWIASFVRKTGMKGTVFGLSGGIDSAVTAVLCKRACGDNALALMMPCGRSSGDQEDALSLSRRFSIQVETVKLDGAYEALLEQLNGKDNTMAGANLKSRLRMASLYYVANTLGYLVVGTGNKSEIMAGYFTKYGDGGVDLLPLGGLYKTEVRELAKELQVPARLVEKKPSAGLWPGQLDEEEMGMTYEELDDTLKKMESGRTDTVNPDLLDRVTRMTKSSAHKRSAPPVFEP